jgi:ferric-dicitrate binding protein FerR (iron transport regulator)
MKRTEQTYEELIENTSFNDWVLSDRVVDNDDWDKQSEEKSEMMEEAANLIQAFQFDKKSLPPADIDAAWSMLDDNISARIKLGRRVWIRRIAAAILVLATASTFWFTSTKKTKTIGQSTDFGEQLNVNLPDASMAQLSANTELTFNKKWDSSQKREVSLEGQAFFDVETTADKATFTVNTEHFQVEVLGTQFDVMARESVSSVAVKEGKVRVKLPVNSKVVIDDKTIKKAKVDLLPGDKLTFKDDKYFVTKVDINKVNAHQIVFDNVNTQDLSNIFKDIYGYELEFRSNEVEGLADYNFQTNNPLKINLDLLTMPLGLKYQIKDKRIIISK